MASSRRILLAELTARVKGADTLGNWNPSDKAAPITLSSGNLVATRSAATAGYANVRLNVPIYQGAWYFETKIASISASNAFVGIAPATAGLTTNPATVGQQTVGVFANGNIFVNGTNVGSLGALANNDVLRHLVDMDSLRYWVARNGGAFQGPFAIPFSGVGTIDYYPYFGADLSAANYQVTFQGGKIFLGALGVLTYAVPDGYMSPIATPGTYSTTTIYLGSEPFLTASADSPSNTLYLGRISGEQDVESVREVGCWPWSSNSNSNPGQFVLVNTDGGLDFLKDYEWWNCPIKLYSGLEGQARAAFTTWFSGFVKDVMFTAEQRIVVSLVDPLSYFDRPMMPALVDPTYLTTAQNVVTPVVIGRPLYCSGLNFKMNAGLPDYMVAPTIVSAHRPILQIDQIYDRGDLFLGPNDPYVAHTPMTAAGGGAFTTWAGTPAVPAGWAALTAFGATTNRFFNSASACRCQSDGQGITAMYETAVLNANYRYTLSFTVTVVTKAGTLIFRIADSSREAGYRDYPVLISATGVVNVSIDTTVATNVQMVMYGSVIDVTIDSMSIASVQIIDWNYLPNNASTSKYGFELANVPAGKVVCNPVGPYDGANVVEYLPGILLYMAKFNEVVDFPPAAVSAADAAAIDTAAHYQLATYITQPITQLQFINNLMDCFCGWIVPDRAGTPRLGRLTIPSATSVLTLDNTNIQSEVVVELDVAKGLTSTMAGQKNHSPHNDSDIATSVAPTFAETLKRQFGVLKNALYSFNPFYSFAQSAPPKETYIRSDVNLQAEANRIGTMWSKRRYFYSVTVLLTAAAADALECGQTVTLVWPRYGLSAGANLVIVGITTRFFSRRVELKLWG